MQWFNSFLLHNEFFKDEQPEQVLFHLNAALQLWVKKTNYSKDVFPNINRTQATEVDLDVQTRPDEGPSTSSV